MHFDITVLSIMCDKCSSNDEKIFREKESIEILKVHGLIKIWRSTKWIYSYFKEKIWLKKTLVKNLNWKT